MTYKSESIFLTAVVLVFSITGIAHYFAPFLVPVLCLFGVSLTSLWGGGNRLKRNRLKQLNPSDEEGDKSKTTDIG